MNKRRRYDKKLAWIRRFYNSMAWRKKRAYILLRDKFMCQHCKKRIEEKILLGVPLTENERKIPIANEVHHIKELKNYPHLALVDSNLISLCRDCHEATKPRKKEKAIPGVRIIKA